MINNLLMALLAVETPSEVEETTTEAIMTAGNLANDFNKKANAITEYFNNNVNTFINFAINVIIAIVIFIVGRLLIKATLKFLNRVLKRSNVDIGVVKFLHSCSNVLLHIMLLGIVCSQVGIKTTSVVAVVGSAGIAVGLALQGSLANFAGGVLILLLKPFTIGDYIVDGGSGKEGTVQKIDLFYTHLVTADNKKVVIPNGQLANSNLTNITAFEKRRLDIEVGISYSSSIEKAKKIIEQIAKNDDRVLKQEEIFVFVSSLDESQVTLGVRVWVKTEDYWNTRFDMNEKIKNRLDENGIEIPFNQLEVHVKNSN